MVQSVPISPPMRPLLQQHPDWAAPQRWPSLCLVCVPMGWTSHAAVTARCTAGVATLARRGSMGSPHHVRRGQKNELTELRKQVSDLQAAAVERRRVEQALRHTAEQQRRLLDHAPVGLCWLTEHGQVLLANDVLVSRLGYRSAGELIEFCRTFGLFRSDPDDPDPAEARFVPPAGRGRAGLRRSSGEVVPAELLVVAATGAGYRGVVVAVL